MEQQETHPKYSLGDIVWMVGATGGLTPTGKDCPSCGGQQYYVGVDDRRYRCAPCHGIGKVQKWKSRITERAITCIHRTEQYFPDGDSSNPTINYEYYVQSEIDPQHLSIIWTNSTFLTREEAEAKMLELETDNTVERHLWMEEDGSE